MKYILILSTAFLITSCGNNATTNTENIEKSVIESPKNCTYKYNKSNYSKVFWTAFKTSNKIGVGGSFNNFDVNSDSVFQSLTHVLKNTTFGIETISTNTLNEDRDKKIVNSFFGKMLNTMVITGKVESVKGDQSEGKCMVEITMNEQSQTVDLNYKMYGDTLKMTGGIDINNFKAENALTELNKVCNEMHKGKDGKSITWPTVDIGIESVLDKKCD